MHKPTPTMLTAILLDVRRQPNGDATVKLADALYPELRRVAGALMRRERPGHTLQPTELVNEAFLRLIDAQKVSWQDRAHFLGVAARVMRQILVDHARRRKSQKRGGVLERVTFDEQLGHGAAEVTDVLDLHQALERFAALDARGALVAELHLFGGLSVAEAAQVAGVSERTARNDWSAARLWLARELSGSGS